MELSAKLIFLTSLCCIIVLVRTAHLPIDESVQTYFDTEISKDIEGSGENSKEQENNGGETNENNPMEMLEELLSISKRDKGEDEAPSDRSVKDETKDTNSVDDQLQKMHLEQLMNQQKQIDKVQEQMKRMERMKHLEQMKRLEQMQKVEEIKRLEQVKGKQTKKDEKLKQAEQMRQLRLLKEQQMKQLEQQKQIEQMKEQQKQIEQMKEQQKQIEQQKQFEQMKEQEKQLEQMKFEAMKRINEQDIMTKQELINLFQQGVKGVVMMFPGCALTQFIVKGRCGANVVELSVASRVSVQGRLSLVGGRGQMQLDGAYHVFYAVRSREWKLTTEVMKGDLDPNCPTCNNLKAQFVIQVGEYACGMEVECKKDIGEISNAIPIATNPPRQQPPQPPQILPDSRLPSALPTPPNSPVAASIPHKPAQIPSDTFVPVTPQLGSTILAKPDPTLSAKSKLTVYDFDGIEVDGPLALASKVKLVVSVWSVDIVLDMHVVMCEARDEGSRSITLAKDGCSSSQVMSEFTEDISTEDDILVDATLPQENSGIIKTRVRQQATLQVFNTRASTQEITFVCDVKICTGECPEKPSCVESEVNLGRARKQQWPQFSRQVTLSTTITVLGFQDRQTEESDTAQVFGAPPAHNDVNTFHHHKCVSYSTVYILLAGLTIAYVALLIMAVVYINRCYSKITNKHKYLEDDTESPSRALYTEYSSPRKRNTPKSSPDHSIFPMNNDMYRNSPASQGRC